MQVLSTTKGALISFAMAAQPSRSATPMAGLETDST
jgi:hypothetical protein